ncbi:MAG TPA: 50S ribosomal protein L18 [Candidatus Saccharimonadales bacterium]|nr:50S ribosomal protein L18 [Candidatus Saccharimonadales bacterium]
MERLAHKKMNQIRRALRTRAKIRGTAARPRLSVHISHTHINAQLIDDDKGQTLVAVSTVGKKAAGTMTEKAAVVGKDIAAKAKKSGVKRVVFDRGAKQYHGRIKALAEAARAEGLEF